MMSKSDFTLMACDVQMFCETRLMNYDTENTNSYQIQDYHNVFFEGYSARNIRSSYVLEFYTKYHILKSYQAAVMVEKTSNFSTECAVINVRLSSNTSLNISSINMRPNTPLLDFKSALFNVLALSKRHRPATDSNLQKFDLLMGDFNMDWVEQSTQNFMKELLPGYKKLIHESTTDYGSTLDHFYTNIPIELIQCVVTESDYTDHQPVICMINL